MKRLLILGSANVHCKLIKAAKEMGIYTYVADYLDKSDGKDLADSSCLIDIKDVNRLKEFCESNDINGVIATHLDPCQRPYQKICHEMNYFCYGDEEQFKRMTDKHSFKKMCMESGVDTIPEYSEEDVEQGKVDYPVFIKPVDSRGSRGQAVCYNREEAINAIVVARKESSNDDVLIEKYICDAQEIQITYFYIDGKPYLIRTADSYKGKEESHLEKVVACAVSPSQYTDEYIRTAHARVIKMFEGLGIKNGPIFMQGFYDNGAFCFFDPGLRFPGVDYDLIYPIEYNIDLMKLMVEYAINGKFGINEIPEDMYKIHGKRAAVLFPVIKKGMIKKISGVESIKSQKGVFSLLLRHTEGANIDWTYDVNQRIAEIDMVADNTEELKQLILSVQSQLKVQDAAGEEMIFDDFDIERIV